MRPWTWPGVPWASADPFELVVDRLLLARLLALLLLQPLGFLLQIAGIIGFIDVITAAIELEHPVHDIVEESSGRG
jgi:hypothetical protein